MKCKNIKSVFIKAKILFSATLLFSALNTYAAEEPVLKVATEGTYAPWSFKDSSGQLQGFDVDISNALCDKMKMKCDIVAQEWGGIIPGLKAHRYDAIIASMSTTPERRKQVLFTNMYKKTISSFIAVKGSFTDISPSGLAGKRIGVQRGSSQHQWLVANGFDKESTLVLYDTTRQPELDLAAGRVDLIIANKATEAAIFMKTPEAKDFAFVGPDLMGGVLGDGNAIAVRLDDKPLCDKLNAALAELIKDGTYAKIQKKYFDFNLM